MYKKHTTSSLLEVIKIGNSLDANDACKEIIKRKLNKKEILSIVKLLSCGKELHNKIEAAYALSWVFLYNKISALPFLIDHLENKSLHNEVRAQCAEGIAYNEPDKRNKYRKVGEKALMNNLKDSSPEVRFWCCFAIGQWKMKNAISILRNIKNHDSSVCPGWWYVSEEAEDAIDTILGIDTKDRLPIYQRK